jgi:hypothetical protein
MLGWDSFLRIAISFTTSSVLNLVLSNPPVAVARNCAVALLSVEQLLLLLLLLAYTPRGKAPPSPGMLVGEQLAGPIRPLKLLLLKALRLKQRCCDLLVLLANCDLRQTLTA